MNVMQEVPVDILPLTFGWDPQIVKIFMERKVLADVYNAMAGLPMKVVVLLE